MSWEIEVNLSGVNAAGMNVPPTEKGAYKVKVFSTEKRDTQAGNQRAIFRTIVQEGKYKGCSISDGINFPKDPEDFVKRYWKALLMSLGFTEAKLDKGIKLNGSKLVGKIGYVFFSPAEQEGSGYSSVKWIPKEQYEQLIALAATNDEGFDVEEDDDNSVNTTAATPSGDGKDALSFLEI